MGHVKVVPEVHCFLHVSKNYLLFRLFRKGVLLDDLSLLTAKQDSIEQTKKLRKSSHQCCIDSGTVAKANRENYQINSLTKICKIARQKNDTDILAITSEELTAKEARYHASCYRVYTRPTNEK